MRLLVMAVLVWIVVAILWVRWRIETNPVTFVGIVAILMLIGNSFRI